MRPISFRQRFRSRSRDRTKAWQLFSASAGRQCRRENRGALSRAWWRDSQPVPLGRGDPLAGWREDLPLPGYLRVCERRLLAKTKLRAAAAAARVSPASFRPWKVAAGEPQLASKQVGNGAGRWRPCFPRPPEPFPREDEAAKEKVYLVCQRPGREPAPRR